ncbi:MAG: secondary thiamine-phosphate synthase enzyme YjbQ [Acidimicrobiales bacterium]
MSQPPALRPVAASIIPTQLLELDTRRPQELVDVTEPLAALAASAGLTEGMLSAFCPHTSAGLAVTEAEEGLHADLADIFEHLAPAGRYWAHDDLARRRQNLVPGDRPNGHAHMRALLATLPQLSLPIVEGRLGLGEWQRVYLVELDGGRRRRLRVSAWGIPR